AGRFAIPHSGLSTPAENFPTLCRLRLCPGARAASGSSEAWFPLTPAPFRDASGRSAAVACGDTVRQDQGGFSPAAPHRELRGRLGGIVDSNRRRSSNFRERNDRF